MNASQALHPTDQTLHDYGLGRLDEESAGSVVAHLEGCPDCRRRVAELSPDGPAGRNRVAKTLPASSGPAAASTDELSMLDGVAAAVAPTPAGPLPPGLADHPDYKIVKELGRGGMGVVYLAQNTLMGRMEVLKVVGAHLISRPAVLERFLREIRSAARLHHPNIVTAYTALRFDESLVLAMEYAEGLDLAKIVKAKGPLPVAKACSYVQQAALGLQHAHEHGMVHRDIKPANLMLARAGNKGIVKVLDFGLAKVTSEGQADSGLTREGQMLGTPDYIAPEQIRDAQSADIRADIYSLGCTFYYLLTGGPPFKGANLWDLYQSHFSMDAGPLNVVRPEVPVELAALVAKMMAKAPDQRFQTPGEVARALSPFIKSTASPSAAPSGEWSRSGLQAVPGRRPTGAAPAADGLGPSGTLIEVQEDESFTRAARSRQAGPIPSPPPMPEPAETPAGLPSWFWPSMAAGVLVMVVLAGAFVVVSRRQGQGEPARVQASTLTDEKVQKPGETSTASGNRADSTSTLSTLFDPSSLGANDRESQHAQTDLLAQSPGTDEDLSAADEMKSEPGTAAGKTETGSNPPSATAIAESLSTPAFNPKPMAPGGLIQADFRNLADGTLPAGWTPRFKNVTVQGGPQPALVLIDPARAERITLPRADLTGDFTIDLEFALPASTTVQLHLQGAPTENLYASVFANGIVQIHVAKDYRLPSPAFRRNATNRLRLERIGGKYRVEMNDVTVGDVRINIGKVHYKALWLSFGATPAPPARSNVVGRNRAPAPPPRPRVTRSPRIYSLRVALPDAPRR